MKCSESNPSAPTDVYYLHGFLSHSQSASGLMYAIEQKKQFNVLLCNFDSSEVKWADRVQEIHDFINNRKRPSILIGKSAGATQGIAVGLANDHVTKVFAMAGLYDETPITTEPISNVRATILKQYLDHVLPIFPSRKGICREENRTKFFILHGKNDYMVPVRHAFEIQKKLCLPDENVFIIDNLGKRASHHDIDRNISAAEYVLTRLPPP